MKIPDGYNTNTHTQKKKKKKKKGVRSKATTKTTCISIDLYSILMNYVSASMRFIY